uniref:Uncharacterized protein n=1 Tax=Lactuca sativa TaxID=4236 RepID=A0A9R1WGB2_LACSA|nr:hypothetical protein LSAT_V11C100032510 [Lactuca sativa]
MAVVVARATRLPIYSSFAKGEAISTVFNVLGLGTSCLQQFVHLCKESVSEEMRAAPVNTLNPQRSAMIIEDFIKSKLHLLSLCIAYFCNFGIVMFLVQVPSQSQMVQLPNDPRGQAATTSIESFYTLHIKF